MSLTKKEIMNYSKAVRTARSLANISQQELAKRADLNRSYISLIEADDRKPSTATLDKIAKALNIPVHLFTLLAVEESDKASIGQEQIQSLAKALAELLLQSNFDEVPGDAPKEPIRANKPSKLTRSRVATG